MKNLDIIEFNKVLNFELFDKEIILISFCLSILFILIVFIYSKYSQQIVYIAEREMFMTKIKKQYTASISTIDINDLDFFYKINLNIKSFLDELELFPGITKMTKKEIFKTNHKIIELKGIIEQCEKYEFSTQKNPDISIKQSIKEKALLIIK